MNGASIDHDRPERRSLVIARACLCLCITVCGLALRGYGPGLGLGAFVVKYGGSMLWGAMLSFLVALAASNLSRQSIALVSILIAICVELFRLVHAPWLDQFRLTLPGALLLGRIFSAWNRRAAARSHLLSLEPARLWRRNRFGNTARLAGNAGFHRSKDANPSLPQLKPLEPMQLLLDPAL
jgi:hypothetical protein